MHASRPHAAVSFLSPRPPSGPRLGAWPLVALLVLPAACGDEPKRPLGATCEDDSQCESGLCVDGICVAPANVGDTSDSSDVADATVMDAPDSSPAFTTIVTARPAQVGNDPVAVFVFVSDPPGATFECVIDDGEPEPCVSPLTIEAGEGEHTLLLIARWPDGAVDPAPPTFTWTVDLTSPVTTFVAAPGAFVASSHATFELEADEADVVFSCSLDGDPWEACSSPHDVLALMDGAHRLEALA